MAFQSLDRSTSLGDGMRTRHFWAALLRSSRSGTFVKGGLEAFKDHAKFGRTPTDQTARGRLFHFAAHLDEKETAKRAAEAEARAKHPQASTDMSASKDTARAAEDTKPGPPKDQRPGTHKRANFTTSPTARPVLSSALTETAYNRALRLGLCFRCGEKGHRSSSCTKPQTCALCAGLEAPKPHTTNDCHRLSAKKTCKPGSAGRAYRGGKGWTQSDGG